jgi:hypothetical protein
MMSIFEPNMIISILKDAVSGAGKKILEEKWRASVGLP